MSHTFRIHAAILPEDVFLTVRQFGLDTLTCAKSGVGQEHKKSIEGRERIRCSGAMMRIYAKRPSLV